MSQTTSGNSLSLPKSTTNSTLEDFINQFAITQIAGGTGIDTIPSPIDSGAGIISIADTGIVAGILRSPYSLTVNAQGQITAADTSGQKPRVILIAVSDPPVVAVAAINNVAFTSVPGVIAQFTVPVGQGFSGNVMVEGQFFIDTSSQEPSVFANLKLSGVDIVGTDRQVYNDRVSGANGSGNKNITMKWIINAGVGVFTTYTMGVRASGNDAGSIHVGGNSFPFSKPAAIMTIMALP